MNCKECEKKIPDFINRKLDFYELKEFDEHVFSCEKCREELDIQFLVEEGMQHLEEGDTFDLQRELNVRIAEAKRNLRLQKNVLKLGTVLECLAVLVIMVFVVWIIV